MNRLSRPQPGWGITVAHLFSIRQRRTVGYLATLGTIIAVLIRSCIPITLPQLVIPENISETERESQCPRGSHLVEKVDTPFGVYNWSDELQKFILMSFYFGYMITQIPMGMLSDRCGFKWPFLCSILSSAIVIGITPFVIESTEHYGLIGINILLGITQGGLFPSVSALIAHWYPLIERSSFGAMLLGTYGIGVNIMNILSQWALDKMHWSTNYYLCAIIGLVWCVIFAIFCYSTPELHPCILPDEKLYLRETVKDIYIDGRLSTTPWKVMLTSLPVWAYIIAHVGHDWVLYDIMLDMPIYLEEVLHFPRKSALIWTTISGALLCIAVIGWGHFSDYLLRTNLMNLNDLRKMNTLIGTFGPAFCLLFSSYARCHYIIAISFFILCICAMAPFCSGASLNAIDLCPNYAGALMGVSNGLGCLSAIAPSILNIISTETTLAGWRNVFWLDFIIVTSTAIIYLLFGKSKVQKWNLGVTTAVR